VKSGIIAVVLAGIVITAGIMYSFIRENDKPIDDIVTTVAKPKESSKVIHVDELVQNPKDFQSEFVLRGVVAGVRKSEGIFAVIDSREFESCGVLTCAANTIPVKFDGELPNFKSIVEITGRVIRNEKGLIIDAERVEVVK